MSNYKFGNEYPVLLTISMICKVIGIAIVFFSIIGFIYGIILLNSDDTNMIGVILIFSTLLSGLLFSVPFFAFAELIKVFVRIEFNTRKGYVVDTKSEELFNEIEAKSEVPKSQINDKKEVEMPGPSNWMIG